MDTVTMDTVPSSCFCYVHAGKTYELCKEGRDGLRCHVVSERNPSGQTMTFDRVWGLLLTAAADRRTGDIDYKLKVIYGGGVHREGLHASEGLRNEYLAAPMSSAKMQTRLQTRLVCSVPADRLQSFIAGLEAWAVRFNMQLVHDLQPY
jgi:hypothetical protein